MNAPAWLTARPIAHRGLHDRTIGVIENTRSAFAAAVAGNFAIECDVQITGDGEAVVFHDFTLDRLTDGAGALNHLPLAEIGARRIKGSDDRIEPLADMLAFVANRVPVVVEIKSAFDGNLRLTQRTLEVVRKAGGRVALKSFDPNVVTALRMLGPEIPRGIVAQKHYDYDEWAQLPPAAKERLSTLAHLPESEPDFLSYSISDLPGMAETLRALAPGRPIMSWTVRTQEQRALAEKFADQMVFEGFIP